MLTALPTHLVARHVLPRLDNANVKRLAMAYKEDNPAAAELEARKDEAERELRGIGRLIREMARATTAPQVKRAAHAFRGDLSVHVGVTPVPFDDFWAIHVDFTGKRFWGIAWGVMEDLHEDDAQFIPEAVVWPNGTGPGNRNIASYTDGEDIDQPYLAVRMQWKRKVRGNKNWYPEVLVSRFPRAWARTFESGLGLRRSPRVPAKKRKRT